MAAWAPPRSPVRMTRVLLLVGSILLISVQEPAGAARTAGEYKVSGPRGEGGGQCVTGEHKDLSRGEPTDRL